MTEDRPPRILHAPLDVGGHAYGLSRAERELGLQSDVAVIASGPFGYETDIDLRAGINRPVWLRFARRGAFLARALRKYDLFHFNFGHTLLTVRQFGHVLDELRLLKRLGKSVFVTYQGSDVRAAAVCPCGRADCLEFDRYRQPSARRALRFADRVFYLNPDLREWLPGATFCPYASLDPRDVLPSPEPESDEIVIAHAPTDVNVKGTKHVVAAVDMLASEGLRVRLDLIENVSRKEVLERVRQSHVVVDQVLLGWYGGFAVEAMASGRPALAYIREDEPADNPFGQDLPIVRTTPETLAGDLRALVTDARLRRRAAEKGRQFVEVHHDPRAVAREVLAGYAPALEAGSRANSASASD